MKARRDRHHMPSMHLLASNLPRPPPLKIRFLLFIIVFSTPLQLRLIYPSEAVFPAFIHARHALSHSVQLLRTLTGISSAQTIHVTAGLLAAEAQVSQSASPASACSAPAPASLSGSRSVRLGLDGAHRQPRRISDSPNRGLVLISSFIALRRAFFSLAM